MQIIVFLFTDFLRYKPLIVFEGLAYMATWSLLLFGKGVASMQWMQVMNKKSLKENMIFKKRIKIVLFP